MTAEYSGDTRTAKRRRESRSVFGPIVLIAIGFGFLFYNLDMLPELNWTAVFWAWPFLLIFLGLDLLVRQFGPPLGGLLSGVVAIGAVGFFAWLLLGDNSTTLLANYDLTVAGDVRHERVTFPAADLSRAEVAIHFDTPPAKVFALEDSPQLIDGFVTYQGGLTFDTSKTGDTGFARLQAQNDASFLWFDTGQRSQPGAEDTWQIGLSPQVPMDLSFDVASGSTELNLSNLQLENLNLAGGSGSMDVHLPDGDYGAAIDVASGAIDLTVSELGDQQVEINGGSGAMAITIPATRAVRLELQEGSGPVSALPKRYRLLRSDEAGESIWQTESFEIPGEAQLTLKVDVDSGPLTIREP